MEGMRRAPPGSTVRTLTVTEYFDRLAVEGSDWLTVFTNGDDPRYLSQQFITSTHFMREADASAWNPTPCGAK